MRIVYMGTPDFAVPSLRAILDAGHTVPLVVTRPDQQRDRGKKIKPTPVKALAEERGIPVISPESLKRKDADGRTVPGRADEAVMDLLRSAAPDCIVVAAYGRILPKEILDFPRLGCVNVHGSLLPRWRGAAPVQRAIEAGDETTGVTIMYMGEELDTGDMLAKAETPTAGKTAGELTDELAETGAALLVETLAKLERGTIVPEPQNDADATYAAMVFKKDGLLDFADPPAVLERKVRAMSPWPGAYAYYGAEQLKILAADSAAACLCAGSASRTGEEETGSEAGPEHLSGTVRPGMILSADRSGVRIACGADEAGNAKNVLNATVIQVPGKKALPACEFFKGNTLNVGTVLLREPETDR